MWLVRQQFPDQIADRSSPESAATQERREAAASDLGLHAPQRPQTAKCDSSQKLLLRHIFVGQGHADRFFRDLPIDATGQELRHQARLSTRGPNRIRSRTNDTA